MYIALHMNNKDAKFLVDTGATLSIISSSFYYQLNNKPILEECNKQITSANGGFLTVKGTFNVIVSGKDYPVQFEGKLGCYRIVASETISIPPESEMVISCVVCVPKGQTMKHFEGIVEP